MNVFRTMVLLMSVVAIEGVSRRRRRIGRTREPTFHDKVEAFYRRYVPPEKWKNVDIVSEMYEGREDELNEGLRKKYQADLDDVVVIIPKEEEDMEEDASFNDDSSNDEQVDEEISNEISDTEDDGSIDEDYTTIEDDELDQNEEEVDVFGHPISLKPENKKKKKKKTKKVVKPPPSNDEAPRFRQQQQQQQKSSKSSLMKVIIIITVTTSLGGCVGILAIVFRSRLTKVFEVLKDAVQEATSKAFRQDDEETIRSSRKRHRKKKKRQYVVESSDEDEDEDEDDETTQLLDEETRIVNEEMSSELVKFLNSIGVRPKSVAKKLYEAGFERWDTFRYVSESDLVQFGFRRGRVLLIKQRLKRLMKEDVSRPIEMRPMMASSVLKSSVKKRKNFKKKVKEEQQKHFPAASNGVQSSSDSSEGQNEEIISSSYRDDEEDKIDRDDDSDDEKVSFSSDEDDDEEEDEFDKASKEWNKMKPSTTLKREVNERQRRVDVDWSEDGRVYETPMQTGALAQTQASEQKRNGMFEKFKNSRINNKKKKKT
eukprot:g3892.t1